MKDARSGRKEEAKVLLEAENFFKLRTESVFRKDLREASRCLRKNAIFILHFNPSLINEIRTLPRRNEFSSLFRAASSPRR